MHSMLFYFIQINYNIKTWEMTLISSAPNTSQFVLEAVIFRLSKIIEVFDVNHTEVKPI